MSLRRRKFGLTSEERPGLASPTDTDLLRERSVCRLAIVRRGQPPGRVANSCHGVGLVCGLTLVERLVAYQIKIFTQCLGRYLAF